MLTITSTQPDNGEPHAGRVNPRRDLSENREISARLSEIAALLAEQDANAYRVNAYRNASRMLGELESPVRDVLQHEGIEGLVALPTIGQSIATLIEQYLHLGRIPLLHHLRGEDGAERAFATLPTLGPELSRRIHEQLEIETLPELLRAAQDGRLEDVPGIGRKRAAVVAESLKQRIRDSSSSDLPDPTVGQPDQSVAVSELLDVDAEYRRLVAEDRLPRIAPKKFNPGSVAWLPILHTHRGDRHYTALYSNTARAHQLNTTKDWVIIYRDDPDSHGRWTVITSQFGELQGWRIVRGREKECAEYYVQ